MKKIIIALVVLSIITIPVIVGVVYYVNTYNKEVSIRTLFEQNISDRAALLDKMYKVGKKKGSVVLKADSSFIKMIGVVMSARKDGPSVMTKWVTEQNPTASYKEITDMYKDLSRALEANQEELYNKEQELSRVVAIHKNLLNQFPSNLILSDKEPLKYKPISSDKTDEVLRTGKDNDVSAF